VSAPLDLQLREYTEFFDAELPAIDLEDALTERVGSGAVRPMQPRRPQRGRWVVAAAAAIAVLVAVGGAAWLLRPAGGVAPVDQPTSTVPPTTTATTAVAPDSSTPSTSDPGTASAAAPIDALAWVRAVPPSQAVRLVTGGDRIHAVEPDPGFASVATTTDGQDWEQRTVASPASLGANAQFVAWNDLIVGWGSTELPGFSLAVWNGETDQTSTTGFESDGHEPAVGIGSRGIVVVNGGSFDPEALVVQTFGRDDFVQIEEAGGQLIVTWADGSTDTLAIEDFGFLPADPGDMTGWLSVDGATWTPMADLPERFDTVTGYDDGFIATGPGGAWFSPNGLSWETVAMEVPGWPVGALTSGVVFQTIDGILLVDRFGATAIALPEAAGLPDASQQSVLGAGGSTIAIVDLVEKEYLYGDAGADLVQDDLPPGFPDTDPGAFFTPTIVVADGIVIVGVFPIDGEEFADFEWWGGTPLAS
jgi:hypothetical protein